MLDKIKDRLKNKDKRIGVGLESFEEFESGEKSYPIQDVYRVVCNPYLERMGDLLFKYSRIDCVLVKMISTKKGKKLLVKKISGDKDCPVVVAMPTQNDLRFVIHFEENGAKNKFLLDLNDDFIKSGKIFGFGANEEVERDFITQDEIDSYVKLKNCGEREPSLKKAKQRVKCGEVLKEPSKATEFGEDE